MPPHSLPLTADFLLCSICQDVFTDPVTTPCGHTFCKSCITDHWGPRVPCQCPTCRKVFNTVPHMEVSTVVSEMAAQFKQSAAQREDANDPENQATTPGEVLHKVLRGTMMKAGTSCLACLLCVLIVWTVLGPNTLGLVPLGGEYEGLKLEKLEAKFQEMIQKTQQKIEEIGQTRLQEFTGSVERSLKHLIDRVDERQRKAEAEAVGLSRELVQELSEVKKRSSQLGQLSVSVVKFISGEMKKQMKRSLAEAELKRLQQYAVDLILDPDTANPFLILSVDGKQVLGGDIQQRVLTDHGFYPSPSILSKQSFSSGRFYFEVQVKGKTCWDLGVAKESINRKKHIILTPQNGFWTLVLRAGDKYEAATDSSFYLSLQSRPEKVGVFVDYEEGLVSFYDVDAAALIYSFTRCSFTEKLYPFFSPCPYDADINSAPLVISPVYPTGQTESVK